jgi:hypothetical protein
VSATNLVLTGYADVETAVAAMRLRAVDVRKKPLFGDQLIDAVRKALGHRTADDWTHDAAKELTRDLDELRSTGAQDRNRLVRALARAIATPDLAVDSLLTYASALQAVVAEPASTMTAELIERARKLVFPVRRLDTSHSPTVRAAIGGSHSFVMSPGLSFHLGFRRTYYTNGEYTFPFCWYASTACTEGTGPWLVKKSLHPSDGIEEVREITYFDD